MSKIKGEPPADYDIDKIRKQVLDDERDDSVMIFIPSHEGKKRLSNQDQWADAALRLFGHLYDGATAFMGLKGIWVDPKTGEEHLDEPIMIQSIAKRPVVVNEDNLTQVLEFAK